jgi:DNA-binding response OmpR family regulator
MEELQNKGAGFIHKPFALEQLIQAVREILDAAAPLA